MNASHRLQSLGYRVLGYQPQELRLERYRREAHRDLWEGFLPTTVNGNLFQARRFLEYHPEGRFEDHSLLFWRGDQLFAVAAGEAANGLWLAHRFTSHGGIAVRPHLSAAEALDVVFTLLSYAEAQGWTRLSLRFVPDILAEAPFTTLAWALSIFGFTEDSREMTWCAVPRFSSEQQLLESYHESEYYAVTKALRHGLMFRETDDFARFWQLLESGLKQRFEVAPTHSLAEIRTVCASCPGEVRLHGIYTPDGGLIAGGLIFDVSGTGSHCFYLAQDYAFQNLRAMPLLMHSINAEYAVKRARKLNYGVFTAHGAEELNLGLSRFKSKFSSVPSIRRRFTWERKS